ncbi:hypothetical protein H0E84_07595 [Luteimonas sp. SJ-92]|uniref:CdiI immunity protein domain-containing protein n=1 Tax=Luteimonas salinisoli TaxID=2752307 RepID=A0A853JC71_9GAMM|nr:contact-dependent growth inhibition system immunity protein [Luteimonas salinisoli]NZA26247.1 hypothetical protein [Luteimonas salinisoli]
MRNDPAYLASLGELATLKNAIGAWFHQDAYLDFASDEDVWDDMFAGHDSEARQLLMAQIAALLQRSDDAIVGLWNSQAHSHTFASGAEARHFFGSMLEYFYGRGHVA